MQNQGPRWQFRPYASPDNVGKEIEKGGMREERLLATDVDGTFLGDRGAMLSLWEEVIRAGILVAFATGRHMPSIERLYAEIDMPFRADACACMVGTEVWILEGAGYRRDDGWSQVIAEGWDRPSVEEIAGEFPELVRQPEEWQSAFKCSYFLVDNAAVRLAQIRRRLEEDGVRAKVVYSHGRFLDLLPFRSGKGEAVAHLARRLGVAPSDVVTAGDTGNDLDMMRPELGFNSIAVANATAELRGYRSPSLYQASAPFAEGIREGLVHFGWLVD